MDSNQFVQRVQVPSRGLLYGDKMPDGWVSLSPMTTRHEKRLLTVGRKRERVLDDILRDCLVDLAVPYEELLVGDKYFLLFALRNITYGPEYGFEIKCPECGAISRKEVEIPQGLKVKELTEDDLEPFYVDLPLSKKRVGLRHFRVKDEQAVNRFTHRELIRQGGGQSDVSGEVYIFRLALRIVSIDGEEVQGLPLAFVEGLYGRDSLAIRQAVDAHECGLDLTLDLDCPRCGAMIRDTLPVSAEFFRPGATESHATI